MRKALAIGLLLSFAFAQKLELHIPAFANGRVPAKYTCAGAALSPAFNFTNLPAGTKSLALLFWDPDYPKGLIARWVLYDIPTSMTLPEGVARAATLPGGIKQGKNGLGKLGYDGPCPAKSASYQIDLYALNVASLGLPPGASLHQVKAAIQKHRLQESIVNVTFKR
ncbi:MAG: YbhB/YbcL family Raf kinase inhibitor-like protein [Thermaceae bacterium]|nr:YbhB/YbcL family Raf kinase inhibitor-like protein [Thermaceae bacterium]